MGRTCDCGRFEDILNQGLALDESGGFSVAGTDLAIDLCELAACQAGAAIVVQASAKADGASWSNACPVAEVEDDPAKDETS